MRRIEMESWSRREHFELFGAFDHPHFGMTANVDITPFYAAVKERGYSINTAIVYVLSLVANGIPEFRYRIRQGDVVEHEVVHPATTIMADEDVFSFCTFDYVEDFSEFAARAAENVAHYREHPTLQDEPGRDDYLFMTAIPWVSFTGKSQDAPQLAVGMSGRQMRTVNDSTPGFFLRRSPAACCGVLH